jgi:hypothetical protein
VNHPDENTQPGVKTGSETALFDARTATPTPQFASVYERAPVESAAPLQQGEFISGLVQTIVNFRQLLAGETVVDDLLHPFVIIVTQSCDLEWDFSARARGGEGDKLLPSIFVCEALDAGEVKGRRNARGEIVNNSKIWERIKGNKEERFHFFERVPPQDDLQAHGLPEIVVDFKRYFSVPTDELYWRLEAEAKRRTRLKSPYLEHFVSRFFYYQARVALPRPHSSEP